MLPGVGLGFTRAAVDLPSHVEGIKISENIHLEGTDGAYQRLRVRCPLQGTLHGDYCGKYRGLGRNRTLHFGRIEAWGYLGCWLKHANTCSTARTRKRYRPSVSDVRQYLVDHNKLPA